MTDAVKVVKHLLPESGRQQRAENAGGNVSKDFYTFNQLGYDIEASCCAAAMREKFTGCAVATAVFDSTEVAEIGRLAGVDVGKVDGVITGTEVGLQLV
jgi:hypothetical protein